VVRLYDRASYVPENARKFIAAELAALVAVDLLGLAMLTQGVFEAVSRLHAVADAPTQHPPGVPVDHGDPVGKATLQTRIGYIGTPDLIGTHCWHATRSKRGIPRAIGMLRLYSVLARSK
jgi:hypothetical protein